jgi:peptide/nickel transport system substrate-binding protein
MNDTGLTNAYPISEHFHIIRRLENSMQIGRRLAHRLHELRLTQRQLAKKTGLTQPAISKYIHNKAKPGYQALTALSKALEVPAAWFFEEGEPEDLPTKEGLEYQSPQKPVPLSTSGEVIAFPKPGEEARGTTLVIGHYLPMQNLVPPSQVQPTGITSQFYSLIFNSLVQPSADRPRGMLAVDSKQIKNGWLFRLRGGVRFHNGKSLKAEDVVWSYEQYLRNNAQQVQSVEAVDDSVVRINLHSPCRLEELPMPPIVPEGMGESPEEWVGTGPFKATDLQPGFWRLEANSKYFSGEPYFNEIQIREYADPEALEEALGSGAVHFGIGIDAPGDGFTVQAEATGRRYHLHFLLDQPLAQSLALRKAIAYGLDREALAEAAGLKAPHYSAGPFDYILNDQTLQPALPSDLDTAKSILKAVENPEGSVFRIQCHNQRFQPLAEELVAQLNRLGVSAEVSEDSPHALLMVRNTQTFEEEHRLWLGTSSSALNKSGYSNAEVDALIQACLDDSATSDRLRQLRRLIQQDLPDIPLFYDETPVTYVKQLGALENRLVLLSSLSEIHTWYLDADEVAERGAVATAVG